MGGNAAAYISNVLIDVHMSYCSGVFSTLELK